MKLLILICTALLFAGCSVDMILFGEGLRRVSEVL